MTPTALNLDLLAAASESIPADALSVVRKHATESFGRTNLPTQKDEDWKYTNLAEAATLSNEWLASPGNALAANTSVATQSEAISELQNTIDAHWLVIRNGEIDATAYEKLCGEVGPGLLISRLTDGAASGLIDIDEPLSAFNAALLRDGLSLRVTADAHLDKPIGLIFVDDGTTRLTQSRLIVACEENSRIGIIECMLSAGDAQFTNHVGQVDLAPSSRLDYVRIQQRDSAHLGTNRLTARLEQNANFHHCAFDFGSAMSRNEIVATIAGPGAEANLHGLYLSDRQQHIDNHLAVIHDVGPANSLQDYRGILTGRSRCVFNGKAKVMQGADGTDANQSNHNLLLSDTAEIDTKPELEIYADDVKCSHGATVGQLDENAIFYLRSRGLSRNDARQILTRAFATKVLKNLPVDESRAYVSKALEQRLTALTDDISAHGGGQ